MIIKNRLIKHLPKNILNFAASLNALYKGDILTLRRRMIDLEKNQRASLHKRLETFDGKVGIYQQQATINQHEFSVFSQNGEDGILLFIFSQIGTTDQSFIEFGIGNGRTCNSANLALNFGWNGLFMEINAQSVADARQYYQGKLGENSSRVRIEQKAVSVHNIDRTIQEFGFSDDIDLLSIDIDSNDYWVWDAIKSISPRVVVTEYNASLGPEHALTVKHDPNFHQTFRDAPNLYHGASLTALYNLAVKKGYALVGCDSSGVNAFFVKTDLITDELPHRTPSEAFFPSFIRSHKLSQEKQFAIIKQYPLTNV